MYFDSNHNCTINEKGVKTVSVGRGSTASKRCIVCVTVAADGSKLPLLAIFKTSDNGRIAKELPSILPDGMHGCTQGKAWMDNRVMEIWKEIVWKLYVENVNNSVLLFDQMESYIHSSFIDFLQLLGTRGIKIPVGFTSLSQPRDVGVKKTFKTGFVELCQNWKLAEYARLGGIGKILIPGRVEILEFLDIVWKHFLSQIVRNSFKKCGFTNDLGINIDVALEFV